MIHLLTRPSSRARRAFTTVTRAVRSIVAPAALVAQQATQAPDPADAYTADELPPVEQIEAAAAEYDRATDQARRADRGKRAAKKILGRIPAGLHGQWLITRVPSSRQTADLAEITRIFKANGLGPVPMKTCAPSLKVERVPVEVDTLAELVGTDAA